ncbi:hypothetical protein [Desulfosporosinus youngiae]|uniref:hypothetical protein n=1 Tax=Desulfosporosinus youngiae TaxID=339862 RepID=UPI000305C804|nr:hypothetical protein [Desulfosporosinus youngiae]
MGKQASGLQAAIQTKELTLRRCRKNWSQPRRTKLRPGKSPLWEKVIKAARLKLTVSKVSFLYNSIVSEFEELLIPIEEIFIFE